MGMLCLSRKKNERIIVQLEDGRLIKFIVADIRVRRGCEPRARIAIEADKTIAIHREEVWDAIQAEKASA